MTFSTIFRFGSGSFFIFFMALHALLMKGIGAFGVFGIFYFSFIMAFQATFGNDPFFRFGNMADTTTD
jgi:hypothetical protein